MTHDLEAAVLGMAGAGVGELVGVGSGGELYGRRFLEHGADQLGILVIAGAEQRAIAALLPNDKRKANVVTAGV